MREERAGWGESKISETTWQTSSVANEVVAIAEPNAHPATTAVSDRAVAIFLAWLGFGLAASAMSLAITVTVNPPMGYADRTMSITQLVRPYVALLLAAPILINAVRTMLVAYRRTSSLNANRQQRPLQGRPLSIVMLLCWFFIVFCLIGLGGPNASEQRNAACFFMCFPFMVLALVTANLAVQVRSRAVLSQGPPP